LKNLFDLTEKSAVITGGAGLLGKQHARALMQNGCKVMLWDIDAPKLKEVVHELNEEFNGKLAEYQVVDITVEQEIVKVVNEIASDRRDIDILINNAAINPKFASDIGSSRFENYSSEIWNKEIAVGLTGAMLCSKIIGTRMAMQVNKGVILHIASDLSVIAPDQRIYKSTNSSIESDFVKPVSYSVIKTGLIGLTRYLATYWGESGIRVNALSPGGIYDNQNSEFVEKLTNLIPFGRMANQDEYIGAIQFLCSEASSYMTGQNLVIDGGRSTW
jgi:NAD(P)-dependent dehydrogenase (short-subunit alcohol dehydrogenase family)